MLVGLLLALSSSASAQEAAVSGTVRDTTDAVLPGVTITAVHEATGNTFETTSDAAGAYRILLRAGIYRITAQLPGFVTVNRTGLQLLLGQQAVVNFELALSSLEETVTVTGEAPLVDVTNTSLGTNIDPLRMQELPLQGRNWTDLTLLSAGARMNSVTGGAPGGQGEFQLNVDGQTVTQQIAANFGQPRFSRDAIAEFEVITNRFDATQGRSGGMQVNAITKSGTNTFDGSFSGYFRNDAMNAKDFIQQRVLPYSNQQLVGTLGGPIRRDRIHFFGAYEHEREPQTVTYDSAWPSFNIDAPSKVTEKKGTLRVDFQFSTRTRLAVRGNRSVNTIPIDTRFSGGASFHPSSSIATQRWSNALLGTFTQVLGNRAVNEVKAGFSEFTWEQDPAVSWLNHPQAPNLQKGTPIVLLRGYRVGQGHNFSYQHIEEQSRSIRDDFTVSFNKGGRHNLKLGGEYLDNPAKMFHCTQCMGLIDAQGGAVPSNIEQLFPVWNDVSTWNLAALSPITRFYSITVGRFNIEVPEKHYAGWVQDDWQLSSRLTLNLGLRYDLASGMFGEAEAVEPFLGSNRPLDKNNLAPRLGFAYSLNDQTVVRGGYGRFFSTIGHQGSHWVYLWSGQLRVQVFNDGRPDFAANPFNGPIPGYDQALASWQRGAFTRTITGTFSTSDHQVPFTHQASIGLQRQLGSSIAVEADYVFNGSRHNRVTTDINLAYNPVTGLNYPFSDNSRRPHEGWGRVDMGLTEGAWNLHALQTSFTKRMSNNWQASATYSLSAQYNHQRLPVIPGCQHPLTISAAGSFRCDVPIQLHPVFQEEWYQSDDQRHRATFSGIWQMGYGFQLSGLYFFGDNGRATPTSGVDVAQIGGDAGNANVGRLRANGTLIPRGSLSLPNIHRVDMRVQRRFALGARSSIDAMIEVFNLLNHANYGSFVTNESNTRFGQPTFNNNIAFAPRIMQLGFRVRF